MKSWLNRANALLSATLDPPRHELNELDWKSALSTDSSRLAEHISAMANYPGGGYLVFGVDNDGEPRSVATATSTAWLTRLTNIGRDGVDPPVALDHAVEDFRGVHLLFVFVPESGVKPVRPRGRPIDDTFIRSGGSTRKASRPEIGAMFMQSRTPRWEEMHASTLLQDDALLQILMPDPILELLERPSPTDPMAKLAWLIEEGFVERAPGVGGYVSNLGAIAAAKDLSDFPDLSRKAVRVIEYSGVNEARTKQQTEGIRGYAVAFPRLLSHVTSLLPQSEIIKQALRVKETVYPEIALRELIANALIHQDFSVTGTGPLIEIFSDRIEISNPGSLLPSKRLDRLIGTQPESRNERLARAFRRYKICEEQGSGLLKAGLAIELYGLPPIRFEAGTNYFKVTLFAPRTFAQMQPLSGDTTN